MEEDKTYHVHGYVCDYAFTKQGEVVNVTAKGLGMTRTSQISDTNQALSFCLGHGLSIADLNEVNRMLTGKELDIKACGLE